MDHNELGKWGEEYAANYLLKNDYEVLERNWFYDRAEVDIIAKKANELIIVEVKTRNSNFFGDPQDFVSKAKIKLLVKAANEYIISNDLDVEARFDVIAVLKNKNHESLDHFKSAFYHF